MVKKAIYYTAPVTHKTVPKRSAMDVVKAAFDTEDNLAKAPFQSVSEEQKPASVIPVHGLRMWQGILKYVSLFIVCRASLLIFVVPATSCVRVPRRPLVGSNMLWMVCGLLARTPLPVAVHRFMMRLLCVAIEYIPNNLP